MTRTTLSRAAALCSLLCLSAPFVACRAQAPEPVERDEWAAILWGDRKIGFAHLTVAPERQSERAGLVRMSIEVTARLADMGVPMGMNVSIVQWVDAAGRPVRIEAVIPTGAEPTRKTIVFSEGKAVVTRQSYDGQATYTVGIPPGLSLVGELSFLAFPPHEPPTDPVFVNLLTDRVQSAQTKLIPSEGGGWTVTGTFSAGAYSLDLDSDWRLVLGTGAFGVVFDFQSEQEARDLASADELPPVDAGLGVPVDTPLPDPRTVRALVITISGLALEDGPPSIDGRQEVEELQGGLYRVTTWRRGPDDATGTPLGFSVPEELRPYVEPDAFITSGDKAIREVAARVTTGIQDAALVVEALSAWIDAEMTFGGIMDTARSSTQILDSRRGVCRDYAALYTALARSLGIPSRLCTGLVYSQDGFYFHTWAESWLGEKAGWVPVDPTRSGRPVDATHVTFLRGDVESVWRVMEVVGALEIEVERVETGP